MIFSTCFAKNVQVTGQGSTENMALHNAMRTAIEQELGAFVDSKTLVKNQQIISDEISANSEGFISGYKIISNVVKNGIFFVTIQAEVNSYAVQKNLMTKLQKKSLVNSNANNPRIAALAYDSFGREFLEVENEILSAFQLQGFSRIVDLNQVNLAVKRRIISANNNPVLIKTLANDFHIDYLVLTEVKISNSNVSLASRLIAVNTGEIIYTGNFAGNAGMFTANAQNESIKMAAKHAGREISNAALNSAAQVEQHIILLITQPTFQKIGRTLSNATNYIKNFDGVNNVFVRHMNESIELDINFDGTATDFSQELERKGFKILEMTSNYIKI